MNNHGLPPERHQPQCRCGRVSFVAVMDEVRAQIERGVPLVRIYKAYDDRLDIGYSQLTKNVSPSQRQQSPHSD